MAMSGCATVRVDGIQTVIPDIQMRKKYTIKVALIVPPATQNINTIKLMNNQCMGSIEILPFPFGNTFKEIAVGTFSKMFSEVDVINGLPAEKDYDLFIEATLTSLTLNMDCSGKPGTASPTDFQARGTVKLFDNDYREIGPGYQGVVSQGWGFGGSNQAGPVIGNVLSSLVGKYAREMGVSPQFAQLVKERSKPKEQYASGVLTKDAPFALTIKSDIDELSVIKAKPNKKAYAIVIGIESYRQKLPKADYALADAKTMTDYLTKVMGYPEENIVTIVNEHATKGDFEKYLEKWLPNNVDPGSTVFVYYSGHGAPNPKTADAYLVPYDGDPSFIEETGYSLKRMYAALGKLPAKEVIVALDSCFSGAGGRSVIAKGARPIVLSIESPALLSKNMTVLSASAGDQISSTYDEKGHGLFTYFMLKGIKNEDAVKQDGSIDIGSLFDYIKPQVSNIARKKFNNEQTPQLIGPRKN